MSILIKGMEMPDSCFHCKLAEVCQYYQAEHYANKRHEDCPLEEVPETHDKRTETHSCDLIERQAAIDAIEEMQMPIMRSPFTEEQFVFRGMSESLQAIKNLPSAHPEIIRCKDCKQYRRWIDTDICFCDRNESNMMPDDFCSYAERQEDEADYRKE